MSTLPACPAWPRGQHSSVARRGRGHLAWGAGLLGLEQVIRPQWITDVLLSRRSWSTSS